MKAAPEPKAQESSWNFQISINATDSGGKISLIDGLDKKEKAAFFTMLDALVAKKKLKNNLSNVLQQAQ